MSVSTSTETFRTIEKLDENNYLDWVFKIQMILDEKDLMDIVTGVEKRPEEPAEPVDTVEKKELLKDYKAYDKRAKKALATICLSLGDSQIAHVRSCKTANEAWLKLKD